MGGLRPKTKNSSNVRHLIGSHRTRYPNALNRRFQWAHIPGDNSDTGVLDGVGLWPGGKKCDGEPLLEPLPGAPM